MKRAPVSDASDRAVETTQTRGMGLSILDIVDPKVLADRRFHLCTRNYLRGDHHALCIISYSS